MAFPESDDETFLLVVFQNYQYLSRYMQRSVFEIATWGKGAEFRWNKEDLVQTGDGLGTQMPETDLSTY